MSRELIARIGKELASGGVLPETKAELVRIINITTLPVPASHLFSDAPITWENLRGFQDAALKVYIATEMLSHQVEREQLELAAQPPETVSWYSPSPPSQADKITALLVNGNDQLNPASVKSIVDKMDTRDTQGSPLYTRLDAVAGEIAAVKEVAQEEGDVIPVSLEPLKQVLSEPSDNLDVAESAVVEPDAEADEVVDTDEQVDQEAASLAAINLLALTISFFVVGGQKRALREQKRKDLDKHDSDPSFDLETLFVDPQSSSLETSVPIVAAADEPNLDMLDEPMANVRAVLWTACVATVGVATSLLSTVSQVLSHGPIATQVANIDGEQQENKRLLYSIAEEEEYAEAEKTVQQADDMLVSSQTEASLWQGFSGVMQYLWPTATTSSETDINPEQAQFQKSQQAVFKSVVAAPEKPNMVIVTTHNNEQANMTRRDDNIDIVGSRTAVEDSIMSLYKIELSAQGKIELDKEGKVAKVLDADFKLSLDASDIALTDRQGQELSGAKKETMLRSLDAKFAAEFKDIYVSESLLKSAHIPGNVTITTQAPFAQNPAILRAPASSKELSEAAPHASSTQTFGS